MSKQKILVWDLPTRVFHWLHGASFAFADGEQGKGLSVTVGFAR